MLTANAASLLVESSLGIGRDGAARYVHLRNKHCDGLLPAFDGWTPSGTVGSSHHAGLGLNARQRWEELLRLLLQSAFAYSLVVATRLGSICIVV